MTEIIEDKTLYELGFLISGELTEDDAREVKKTLEELLGKHGTISEQGELVTHNLAYRIAKRKTAYFSWIRFETSADHISNIKEGLRYTKNLVRALILKLNKKHLEQETYQIKRSAEYAKNKVESKTNKEEVSNSTPLTTGEVDVQELDKRLAEIL
ncbi:MAG: 30S ribosomal protein S6 [Patescibacteria group bacterium]